jgi:hypothetical protein
MLVRTVKKFLVAYLIAGGAPFQSVIHIALPENSNLYFKFNSNPVVEYSIKKNY